MSGYDFDDTLYKGKSPFDFFLFCFYKKKSLIKYFPIVCIRLFQYKVTKLPIEGVIETVEKISKQNLKNQEQLKQYVEEFWQSHKKKLKREIISQITKNDIIITASPRFLMEEILGELNTKNLICTEFNIKTGDLEFLCYKERKLQKFLELYPDQPLNAFYSDSLNDLPMMCYAKEAYMVKGNKIKKYSFKKKRTKS